MAYGVLAFVCSPLPSNFDRVLQVGDASGIQSPISFGGFGAITRHLGRLTNGTEVFSIISSSSDLVLSIFEHGCDRSQRLNREFDDVGLHDALQADLLDKKSLALLNPYLVFSQNCWLRLIVSILLWHNRTHVVFVGASPIWVESGCISELCRCGWTLSRLLISSTICSPSTSNAWRFIGILSHSFCL